MKNRFSDFNDDELYMLKRQAIEGGCNIVMDEKYSEEEIRIHGNLLNEIIQANKERAKR